MNSLVRIVCLAASLAVAATSTRAQGERGLTSASEPEPPARIGNRWALLIGVNGYEHLARLRYCSQDMAALREALIASSGYEKQRVRLVCDTDRESPNPSAANIALELRRFLKNDKIRADDVVLVAFAGHGDVDAEGRSYLMAIDSSPETMTSFAITVGSVHELMRDCPARQKILMVDACHSGGERGEARGVTLDSQPPATGLVELLSCEKDQVSIEDETLGHGVFSHFLIQGLAAEADLKGAGNADGIVTVAELDAYVHAQVKDYVREKFGRSQTPKMRSEASGQVVLSVHEYGKRGLDRALLVRRFSELRAQGAVSAEVAASAGGWIDAADSFAPARPLQPMLELLATGRIDEEQFRDMAANSLFVAQSWNEMRALEGERQVRALVIAVSDYSRLGSAPAPSARSDAALVADRLRLGGASEVLVLNGAEVTDGAVEAALGKLALASKKRDVVVVYFAGKGSAEGWLVFDAGDVTKGRHVAIDDVFAAFGASGADVMVISDAPDAAPKDEDLAALYARDLCNVVHGPGDLPSRLCLFHPRAALDDFSLPESNVRGSPLAFAVAEALAGACDRDPPMMMYAEEGIAERQDGFATMRELAAFCLRNVAYLTAQRLRDRTEFDRELIRARGRLAERRTILGRVR